MTGFGAHPMPSAMSVPERFDAVLRGNSFDRLPVFEWATWWDKTLERWRAEGLPGEGNPVDIRKKAEAENIAIV